MQVIFIQKRILFFYTLIFIPGLLFKLLTYIFCFLLFPEPLVPFVPYVCTALCNSPVYIQEYPHSFSKALLLQCIENISMSCLAVSATSAWIFYSAICAAPPHTCPVFCCAKNDTRTCFSESSLLSFSFLCHFPDSFTNMFIATLPSIWSFFLYPTLHIYF